MNCIKFKVNEVEYSVGTDVSSEVSLLYYLRSYLQLRGTKYMCREGGCGSCMVTASKRPGAPHVAVNSCLVSIGSCDGWAIRTIEGLGNRKIGYHPLQSTLANHHGTQCGYCSPGWIMAMHGLMESKKDITMLDVERSFGSNLCRCTGYRPILEAFKRFAKDAPKGDRIMDIEDLHICKKSKKHCNKSVCDDDNEWCMVGENDLHDNKIKRIVLKDGKIWFQPRVLQDVFNILLHDSPNLNDYMLVGGNTAKGVVPIDEYPDVLIDISGLQELKTVQYDQNLIVGAGLTLTEFLDVLKTGATQEYFSYLSKLYSHIEMVAHIPVRNLGTIAGNLMIKHENNFFQSDIYLLLDTIGAQLTIVDWHGAKQKVTMEEFLKVNMQGKVILNVMIPPLSDKYKLCTYKLMPRAQSSHAIVNAGFLYKLNSATNVVEEARIVFGALSSIFNRATATESYLVGKCLFTNATLQGALRVLDGEMIVVDNPPEPSVECRRYLAKALFYKIQCAGEAKYTDDIPSIHDEVFGAFVLSTEATGIIIDIDASLALNTPGVIAFYTAKDIPGLNSFTPADSTFYTANEEVLCDGIVKYYYQPIGIIVAETQYIADRASKLVTVKYSNVTKPVVDIKEAKMDSSRNTLYAAVDATNPGTDIYKTISGSNTFYGQYHFPMETLVCVVKPTEEGLEVHTATQWLDGTQVMISRALNLDANSIDVYVRRLGGGFGMKISRSIQSAVACSLVVQKLNRPCRFIQPLTTNFRANGKRLPCVTDYEVAVNCSGEIQYLNSTIYEDNGYKVNETITTFGEDSYYNCYDATKINYQAYDTITDTAKNTFCRSPGTLEAIAGIEYIMERISYELSLDPVTVRLANLDTTKYNEMTVVLDTLKENSEYTTRRAAVDSFNTQNRWKKRGLRWAFVRWSPLGSLRLNIMVSIFHTDGSVVITHAGVEMGQGINTKAAQVAAYLLKIPVDKIKIKGNDTTVAPNSSFSGGSLTTQNIIIGLRTCCEELNSRLEPVRATLTNPTWEKLITAAYNANVDLLAHGFSSFADTQSYDVYGMALSEVEVDVLTGQFDVLRVDILQDVGLSVSPEIDVGQVEGAFIMGLGYWTCEKLYYSDTGEILTDRTWEYTVPEARDIPQDFRIYLKKNSFSNDLILGSKSTGEPAICLSVVIPFAIREAIVHARQESGIPTTEWFNIDGPSSTENICRAINTSTTDFKFY